MRSDSSGKNRNERTDLLWADWGIHHLHVAEKQEGGQAYFSCRGDFLLFAMFGQDFALFVDVQPHSTDPEHGDPSRFAREDLIRVVARNWPPIVEPFQLRGVLVSERQISDVDRKLLRKSGIDAPLVIDGTAPAWVCCRWLSASASPGLKRAARSHCRSAPASTVTCATSS
jgi:hypothetical protein